MSDIAQPYGQRAVMRGGLTFLAGRGASALLTFLAFVLVARMLPLSEYGLLMAALASMELGLALSSAGLDWVATRSLPEYRVHAAGRVIVRVTLKLAAIQVLAFSIGGILLSLTAPSLATLLALQHGAEVIILAAGLLVVEGIGRLCRDQLLGILMHQRSGQLAQVGRSGLLFALLVYEYANDAPLEARDVMQFELISGALAALAGIGLLGRVLVRFWPQPGAGTDWLPPDRKTLFALARNSYFSYLLSLTYGAQVLTMLVARILGAESAAMFGFARTFADQVRRYLPTDLLQSILRPALVAHFSDAHDRAGLILRLGLWLKSALIMLVPLLAFFLVFGEQGTAAVGGQHFRDAWVIVTMMLAGAGTMAWRRVVELACNTLNRSGVCVRAALPLPAIPFLLAAVLYATRNLTVAVALFACAEIYFCWRALRMLARDCSGTDWRSHTFLPLGSALILSCMVMLPFRAAEPPVAVAFVTSVLVATITLMHFRPFDRSEVELIRGWKRAIAQGVGRSRGDS